MNEDSYKHYLKDRLTPEVSNDSTELIIQPAEQVKASNNLNRLTIYALLL